MLELSSGTYIGSYSDQLSTCSLTTLRIRNSVSISAFVLHCSISSHILLTSPLYVAMQDRVHVVYSVNLTSLIGSSNTDVMHANWVMMSTYWEVSLYLRVSYCCRILVNRHHRLMRIYVLIWLDLYAMLLYWCVSAYSYCIVLLFLTTSTCISAINLVLSLNCIVNRISLHNCIDQGHYLGSSTPCVCCIDSDHTAYS
jgi:hypothetical protein